MDRQEERGGRSGGSSSQPAGSRSARRSRIRPPMHRDDAIRYYKTIARQLVMSPQHAGHEASSQREPFTLALSRVFGFSTTDDLDEKIYVSEILVLLSTDVSKEPGVSSSFFVISDGHIMLQFSDDLLLDLEDQLMRRGIVIKDMDISPKDTVFSLVLKAYIYWKHALLGGSFRIGTEDGGHITIAI